MKWFYDVCAMIGSAGYASACVPVAWKTFRLGHARHVPKSTIWLFFVSNTCYVGAMIGQFGFNPFFNSCGILEIGSWAVALWYLYLPRVPTKPPESLAVMDCTRNDGHTGPCNGWPRDTCLVWCESAGKAVPLKDYAVPKEFRAIELSGLGLATARAMKPINEEKRP